MSSIVLNETTAFEILRELVEALEPGASHGCVTGDCPHETANECVESLRQFLHSFETARMAARAAVVLFSRARGPNVRATTEKPLGWGGTAPQASFEQFAMSMGGPISGEGLNDSKYPGVRKRKRWLAEQIACHTTTCTCPHCVEFQELNVLCPPGPVTRSWWEGRCKSCGAPVGEGAKVCGVCLTPNPGNWERERAPVPLADGSKPGPMCPGCSRQSVHDDPEVCPVCATDRPLDGWEAWRHVK